jgi:signal transduction histidine kinase
VGISGMRERVRDLCGLLEVKSDRRGTLVKAVLPIANVSPAVAAINQGQQSVG